MTTDVRPGSLDRGSGMTRPPSSAAWHAAAVAVIWLTSLAVLAFWIAGGRSVNAALA